MIRFIIPGEMTDLNTYVNANRNNKYGGAEIKKAETENVAWIAKQQKVPIFTQPVGIRYTICVKDRRTDEDNLLIYIKWINDGLVVSGVLRNDSPKWLHIAGIEVKYDDLPAKIIVDIGVELW